jgi:hypothetical protein
MVFFNRKLSKFSCKKEQIVNKLLEKWEYFFKNQIFPSFQVIFWGKKLGTMQQNVWCFFLFRHHGAEIHHPNKILHVDTSHFFEWKFAKSQHLFFFYNSFFFKKKCHRILPFFFLCWTTCRHKFVDWLLF